MGMLPSSTEVTFPQVRCFWARSWLMVDIEDFHRPLKHREIEGSFHSPWSSVNGCRRPVYFVFLGLEGVYMRAKYHEISFLFAPLSYLFSLLFSSGTHTPTFGWI